MSAFDFHMVTVSPSRFLQSLLYIYIRGHFTYLHSVQRLCPFVCLHTVHPRFSIYNGRLNTYFTAVLITFEYIKIRRYKTNTKYHFGHVSSTLVVRFRCDFTLRNTQRSLNDLYLFFLALFRYVEKI